MNYESGLSYISALTLTSPIYNAYQLIKLHPTKINTFPTTTYLRLLPGQFGWRILQLGVATHIQEEVSPLAAFGLLGIIQGAIYGHANTHFAYSWLKQPISSQVLNPWRGAIFAFSRDVISQGIPYTLDNPSTPQLLSVSALATLTSHSLHNAQTWMQIDKDATYRNVFKRMYDTNGFKFLYKGVSGRICLLWFTVYLNNKFLKDVWTKEKY